MHLNKLQLLPLLLLVLLELVVLLVALLLVLLLESRSGPVTAALATFAYIPTYAFAPAAGIRGILLIPNPLLYFLRVLLLI